MFALMKSIVQKLWDAINKPDIERSAFSGDLLQVKGVDNPYIVVKYPWVDVGVPDPFYTINYNISDELIRSKKIEALTLVLKSTKLQYLDLSGNVIGDKGAGVLAAELKNTEIQHLDLSGNKIGAEGIKVLAAELKNTEIQHLDLSGNKIGAEGIKVLAAELKSTKLQHLNLSGNKIGDEGIKVLAAGLKNTQVTKINLQDPYLIAVVEENVKTVNKVCDIFKQLVDKEGSSKLIFKNYVFENPNEDSSKCMEQHIYLIKTIYDIPGIVVHLENDHHVKYTKEEIGSFIENIPHLFGEFVALHPLFSSHTLYQDNGVQVEINPDNLARYVKLVYELDKLGIPKVVDRVGRHQSAFPPKVGSSNGAVGLITPVFHHPPRQT